MTNTNYFDALRNCIMFHDDLPNLTEHNCQKIDSSAIQIWPLSVFKVISPLLENPVVWTCLSHLGYIDEVVIELKMYSFLYVNTISNKLRWHNEKWQYRWRALGEWLLVVETPVSQESISYSNRIHIYYCQGTKDHCRISLNKLALASSHFSFWTIPNMLWKS